MPAVGGKRGRMVEGAGVDVNPAHAVAPRQPHRFGQQPFAVAHAGECGHQPDERELALARLAEVELKHADDRFDGGDFEQRDVGVADDRFQLGVGHHQPREPQPRRADSPEQGAILVGGRLADAAQLQGRPRQIERRRRRAHVEVGDDGGELGGGERGVGHWVPPCREAVGRGTMRSMVEG
jgi:hypothetical protein